AGLGGATNQINFVAPPTLSNNILRFATVAGGDFTSYSQGGNTGLAALTSYVTSLTGAGATDNVKLSATDVVASAGQTINSLVISGAGLAVNGAGTLTLGSGTLLTTGGTDSVNVPLAVGTEGIFQANADAAETFNGVISGASLTVAGSGTEQFNAADTYTGGTTLNSGT